MKLHEIFINITPLYLAVTLKNLDIIKLLIMNDKLDVNIHNI